MRTRPLSPQERSIIERFAEKLLSHEMEKLLADADNALVKFGTEDCRVAFEIIGYQRPAYRGQHTFAAEGKVKDLDGADLSVLLHADQNGRLLEMEIVRFDPGGVIAPNWQTLRVW